MASYTLYPPIVDGFMPAFAVSNLGKGTCRVYFSLSKYNVSQDFKNVQVSITKQTTNEKMANTTEPFHRTGVILDVPFEVDTSKNNSFYIEIKDEDIINGAWSIGTTYKVQLRLSAKSYENDNPESYGEATWLNAYASDFSEWSTICILKATAPSYLTFTNIEDNIIHGSEIIGRYINSDLTEYLYSYRIKLFDSNSIELYDSKEIMSSKYQNNSEIRHTMKYELNELEETSYILKISYITINGYERIETINCHTEPNGKKSTGVEISLIETDFDIEDGKKTNQSKLSHISSLYNEEEEGRIGYCLHGGDTPSADFSGVYYIKRTDSNSNFTYWEDIKKITKIGSLIFEDEIYYDYTVESGIWYKYGIQAVAKDGTRGPLMVSRITKKKDNIVIGREYPPSLRDFNYSFLVGQHEKQLRLMFDNTMGSFKYNVVDTNDTAIGSTYAYSRRIGDIKYKSFPVAGLISFNMDENNIFINDIDMYGYQEVADLYNNRILESGRNDFVKEKIFRKKIMDFLYDGKVKLFKSPTEGNILVKLTNINFTPNQSLDRLIYSFTADAIEIAEYNINNCFKYKITVLDEPGNRKDAKTAKEDHGNTYAASHEEIKEDEHV